MSEKLSAVRARWDAFLAKIRERVDAVLAEAHPGCLAVLEQSGFDPTAMSNVFPAIHARLRDLSAKADDTWSQQVDPAFERTGEYTKAVLLEEGEKARALRSWVDFRGEDFEVRTKADAARIIWARLGPTLPSSLKCSHCGHPVAVPLTFVALNLACPACAAVNSFEPGAARMLGTFVVVALAHEEFWEQRHGLPALPRPEVVRALTEYRVELEGWARRYR